MEYNVKYTNLYGLRQHIPDVQADLLDNGIKVLQIRYLDVLNAISNQHHLLDHLKNNSIHTLVRQ
ncbi:MAG: hypothetical protein CMA64_09700 [Euryarchaeota archaeon]|jgi:hypothetical protein|nr:hypothetical protein [Euryarchaeota archaeon]